jgi:hypothetical protein
MIKERDMNEMMVFPNAMEMLIDVLWLMVVWTSIFAMFAVPLIVLCWLFGRSPRPPAVPNKAVWG